MSDNKIIFDMLDGLGVEYKLLEHGDVHTMEDLPPIEAELGAPFFRNLFLTNRQKTEFYLMMIIGDKAFRTAEVSKLLGVARLSFGSGEMLEEMLHVSAGAVNPLSLVHDKGHKINLVIDCEIKALPHVCMHPGSNGQSVVLSTDDLFGKVIPHMGFEPVWVDVKGE